MRRLPWCLSMILGISLTAHAARGQQSPPVTMEEVPKLCAEAAADANRGAVQLPNTARALRERKRLRVLAIGATPLNERDQALGQYAIVEKVLESTFKDVDVEIVDRGVSGEMARDASGRIKTEVALVRPDVVFWQVGVADALALTPAGQLKDTLQTTVRWLKAHDVDVVLIGLKYQRSLARNAGYQQIRQVVREVVREEAILRIGHYESIEALDKVRHQAGQPASELNLSDAGSVCLADFLSRALAVGLFARQRPGGSPPEAGTQPGAPRPVAPPIEPKR